MIDRHLIGDVALAVLLAFPTLAFARPQAPATAPGTANPAVVEKAAMVERTTVERRYDLPR